MASHFITSSLSLRRPLDVVQMTQENLGPSHILILLDYPEKKNGGGEIKRKGRTI